MNDQPRPLPDGNRAARRRWTQATFRARFGRAAVTIWSLLLATVIVILVIVLFARTGDGRFVGLGLLQPAIAGVLSLAIVMGIWTAKGRFVNERRKGVSSASSSAIAVRLWALCFVLLFTAMVISAMVNTAQRHPLGWSGASKVTEVSRDDVSGPQGNTSSTSVRVVQ